VAIAIGALAVGVGVAAVGTVESAHAQKKAANALQDQNAVLRQQTQLQGMRQRTDAIRAGRQALASAEQNAENQGVASSSSAQGGQSSIVSQMISNVSFLDEYNHMTDLAEQFGATAEKYKAKADMWGTITNFGFKVADMGASHL
jgi:uncharacterized protein HemX